MSEASATRLRRRVLATNALKAKMRNETKKSAMNSEMRNDLVGLDINNRLPLN